jgi:protein-tyrosine kinase
MDNIRQAAQLARATQRLSEMQEAQLASPPGVPALAAHPSGQFHPATVVKLDRDHLESKRIIAHDISDPRSTAFDMLRTQVLLEMAKNRWGMLAITSPTPGCGKTLTAINLALSSSRQPETPVLLVDLDLRKPQVAACLGVKRDQGVLSTLRGETPLAAAVFRATTDRYGLTVLITEGPTKNASELVGSSSMTTLLQNLRRDFASHIIIIDTPPMLSTDDTLRLLPQMDCVLLVPSVGTSIAVSIGHSPRGPASTNSLRAPLAVGHQDRLRLSDSNRCRRPLQFLNSAIK